MSNAPHRVRPLLYGMLLGLLAAAPVPAFAQLNGPGPFANSVTGPSAVIPGSLTVTGTQTIAQVGGCSRVSVTIAGSITGAVDDGGGVDQVRFELWDDGVLKDSQVVSIPVGVTQPVSVTLGFQGLYLTGAPGVGVAVYDPPSEQLLFSQDPFFPTDVQGVCERSAPAPAIGSPGSLPFELTALGLLIAGVVLLSRRGLRD